MINGDDPELATLDYANPAQVIRVGVGEHCDIRISGFAETTAGSSFRLETAAGTWGTVSWTVPGLYNARNAAMAAVASGLAAFGREGMTRLQLGSLTKFLGVKRRQELLVPEGPVVVVEDFGHHPGAIRQTLASLRARYPDRFITAAFEPRSNTARSEVFQKEFAECFAHADRVLIGAIHRYEKLAPGKRLDTAKLSAELTAQGKPTEYCQDNQVLLSRLVSENTAASAAQRRRLVVFFTNGSFDGIISGFAQVAGGAG